MPEPWEAFKWFVGIVIVVVVIVLSYRLLDHLITKM